MKNKLILKKLAAIAVAITAVIAAVAAPIGDETKVYAADVTVNASYTVTTTNGEATVYVDPGIVGQSYQLNFTLINNTTSATDSDGVRYSATGSTLGDYTAYIVYDSNGIVNSGNSGTADFETTPVFQESWYGKCLGYFWFRFDAGDFKVHVYFKNKPTGGSETTATAVSESKPCEHEFEWVSATHATEDTNGIEEYRCKNCGWVERLDWVSAYLIFNQNTANKIRKAPSNGTVKIETSRWVSYHQMVFDELAKRPDVTFVTDYTYDHVKYEMTIAPGAYNNPTNQALTLDPNGYAGFRRIAPLYPTTVRQ